MLRSKALQSLQSVPLHCAVRKCGRRIFAYHRAYHSYEHETNPPFTPAETAILSAAFSHVPAYGFTEMALARGARDAGYLDASLNLFPNGAFALVNYHLITKRLALAESQPPANGACSVAEKIKNLVLKRLHANRPIIHHWQQALAMMALPQHIPTSLWELSRLSDEILFIAGDTSVDTSWYTKRAVLSSIYAGAELFMTQDTSSSFEETEAFLNRIVEDAQQVRDAAGMMGTWFGMQGIGLFNMLRSKGVRI